MSYLRPCVAGAIALLAIACKKDNGTDPLPVERGLKVVAGGSGADTIGALRTQALVVEVRDSAGRPLPQTSVRFQVVPIGGNGTPVPMLLCETTDPECGFIGLFIATTTSAAGRASVVLRHGNLAGPALVRISVPDIGAVDTAEYETRPGRAVSLRLPVRDTTLLVGDVIALPATLSRLDRAGNVADTAQVTLPASSANLQRQGHVATASAIGRGFVEVAAGGVRDTVRASVVPTGTVALVAGNTLVVANFAGGQRRDYAGLQAIGQYGLRPAWLPGGTRMVAHSGTTMGALRTVTLATGAISPLPSSTSLSAQWYPDVSGDWVHFTGETPTGTFRTWKMRPDGSELAQVPATTPDYGDYYRPAVSPDGSRIAVSVYENGNIGVRVFGYPELTPLSSFVGNATAPRWSPDGQFVAISSPGFWQIRVMRADGSGLRAVSTAPFGEWFDWTNDSQWLVAHNGQRVTLVSVATGEQLPLPWTVGMWQPAVAR